MVTDTVRRVHAKVRGTDTQDITPGSVPDFPSALACGKFLKPDKLPFAKKAVMVHETIPNSSLSLSWEDLLLVQEIARSSPRQVVLSR